MSKKDLKVVHYQGKTYRALFKSNGVQLFNGGKKPFTTVPEKQVILLNENPGGFVTFKTDPCLRPLQ